MRTVRRTVGSWQAAPAAGIFLQLADTFIFRPGNCQDADAGTVWRSRWVRPAHPARCPCLLRICAGLQDVVWRVGSSFLGPLKPDFMSVTMTSPDLYGPFWVATTLIFVTAGV